MSNHTQGRLIHKRLGVILGGPVEQFTKGSGQRQLVMVCGLDDGSDVEAKARRLVACWNACDGVPTDALEQIDGLCKAVLPYHQLKAQRDSLLAACKHMKGVIDAGGLLNLSRGVELGQTVWYVKASDCMEEVSAAIAAAEKGGAS